MLRDSTRTGKMRYLSELDQDYAGGFKMAVYGGDRWTASYVVFAWSLRPAA